MYKLLFERNFSLLWSAGFISMAGDRMFSIALPLYIYAKTGSIIATSLMVISVHLPVALIGPIAGVLVDRWNLRSVLVWSNYVQAVLLFLLLLVDIDQHVWAVYVAAALKAIAGAFFGPAENALLPLLVRKDRLTEANVLNSLNNNLALLFGPAIGGVLYGLIGVQGVILVNTAAYLVGGVLIGAVASESIAKTLSDKRKTTSLGRFWRGLGNDFSDGIRCIVSKRVLSVLAVVAMLSGLGEGFLMPMMIPFLKDVLHGSEEYIGLFFSVQAVGGLLGGVVFSRYGGRWNPLKLVCWVIFIQGAIDLIQFNTPGLAPAGFPVQGFAIVLVILFGLTSIAGYATKTTLIQMKVDESLRGRVFGAFQALGAATLVLGLVLAGPVANAMGIVPVMNIAGALIISGGFVVYAALRRGLHDQKKR
jgi:MFS family permease